ncbi:hypothetical protein PIB30_086419 [Stylosanthes scabra]|uniref:Uncharacterized protein n=1 Tax=Stylosanthes scabra TaxID=79078 RepID=A0ABU6QTX9_9FABA|nr:hypothetical protein [Stylosanthes scabra]
MQGFIRLNKDAILVNHKGYGKHKVMTKNSKPAEVNARSRDPDTQSHALIGGPFSLVLIPARSCELERVGARLQIQLRPRVTRPTVSSHGVLHGSCDGMHRGARRCDVDREHPEWDFRTAQLRGGVARERSLTEAFKSGS